MKKLIYMLFSFLAIRANAQTVFNGYAAVTNLSTNVLTIGVTDESNGTFVAGERAILIQMQGADLGSNTANTASFGNLYDIKLAGKYEEIKIESLTRDGGGKLTSVTMVGLPTFSFDPNGSLQLVTYKTFIGNYATTSDITCRQWDGSIGGVLAFRVIGNFRLRHNISVDGKGFAGGAINATGDGSACDPINYATEPASNYAFKGEGVAKNIVNKECARNAIVNGGGGGNFHNAGGGGGGGFSAGGNGGPGYDGSVGGCNPTTEGIGGQALISFMAPSSNRLFMGGGGGGGQQNNNVASAGGAGGGIILIKAYDFIVTKVSGSCLNNSITANGISAATNGGNDGQGGGGAGGSIFLDFVGANVACDVDIRANGGNGGHVGDAATHGGGGGGGQGAIYNTLAASVYGNKANFQTRPGIGGNNNNTSNPSTAGNGGGPDDNAIFFSAGTILPLDFLSLKGALVADKAELNFETANEKNVAQMVVEHSFNNVNWKSIGSIQPKGGGLYSFIHQWIENLNYYRIKVMDRDGAVKYSNIVVVSKQRKIAVQVSPNPATNFVQITLTQQASDLNVRIVNSLGQVLQAQRLQQATQAKINTQHLPDGQYFIIVQTNTNSVTEKILIKR
jgi:hypothetical protein